MYVDLLHEHCFLAVERCILNLHFAIGVLLILSHAHDSFDFLILLSSVAERVIRVALFFGVPQSIKCFTAAVM